MSELLQSGFGAEKIRKIKTAARELDLNGRGTPPGLPLEFRGRRGKWQKDECYKNVFQKAIKWLLYPATQ
jgi:hypothetical protein